MFCFDLAPLEMDHDHFGFIFELGLVHNLLSFGHMSSLMQIKRIGDYYGFYGSLMESLKEQELTFQLMLENMVLAVRILLSVTN